MKYLLVLAVVLLGVWLWRSNRQTEREDAVQRKPRKGSQSQPDIMVACLQCGTHLPHSEAVHGRRGDYCCAEHQQLREGSQA